jgi:hypothetical protein
MTNYGWGQGSESRVGNQNSLWGSEQRSENKGRGPIGYKRSDQRITEDLNDKLSDDGYLDASEIEVSVKEGVVTLQGTVSDRSAKRYAEDLAEGISGVSNVENRIRVKNSSESRSSYSSTSGSSDSESNRSSNSSSSNSSSNSTTANGTANKSNSGNKPSAS